MNKFGTELDACREDALLLLGHIGEVTDFPVEIYQEKLNGPENSLPNELNLLMGTIFNRWLSVSRDLTNFNGDRIRAGMSTEYGKVCLAATEARGDTKYVGCREAEPRFIAASKDPKKIHRLLIDGDEIVGLQKGNVEKTVLALNDIHITRAAGARLYIPKGALFEFMAANQGKVIDIQDATFDHAVILRGTSFVLPDVGHIIKPNYTRKDLDSIMRRIDVSFKKGKIHA